jgi:heptosyltransferase-2
MHLVNKMQTLFNSLLVRAESKLTSPPTVTALGEPLFRLLRRRRTTPEPKLSSVRRVLVVRPDEIGDGVMMTPYLRELRRNMPEARITLVVKPALHNLFETCPYVDEVLTYEWNIPGAFFAAKRLARILRLAWRRLWPQHFDLAILPRWDADYCHGSFLTYISGAPWRVGYSEHVAPWKALLNGGYDRLFSHLLSNTVLQHEVLHNLEVIRFLGGDVRSDHLELWLTKKDDQFAEETMRAMKVSPNDLVIALGVGARFVVKRWPISQFTRLTQELVQNPVIKVIWMGGAEDVALGAAPAENRSVLDCRGKTTLRQAAALLRQCALYIGNDTGPMHLAAGVGTPVVELCCHPLTGSPLTSPWPDRFRPWKVAQHVLRPERPTAPCVDGCAADESHCIKAISVDQVLHAARELLEMRVAGNTGTSARYGTGS